VVKKNARGLTTFGGEMDEEQEKMLKSMNEKFFKKLEKMKKKM
jgi:hypothetical protein